MLQVTTMRFYEPVGHMHRNANVTVKTFSSNGNNPSKIAPIAVSNRQRTNVTDSLTQESTRNYLNEDDLANSFTTTSELTNIIRQTPQIIIDGDVAIAENGNGSDSSIVEERQTSAEYLTKRYLDSLDFELDNNSANRTVGGGSSVFLEDSPDDSLMDEEGELYYIFEGDFLMFCVLWRSGSENIDYSIPSI